MTRARSAGFSLLEVLGAIAILGIWFAIISEIAMLGLRNEGRSHRAMLASLVADQVLVEMEIGMLSGEFPEVATDEQQRDGYTVLTIVEPYDLQLPEPVNAKSKPGGGPAARGGQPGSPFKRLGGGSPGAESPLLRVTIEVIWFEGNSEDSVSRETFAVDLSQAQQALTELAARSGETGAAGGGPDSGADGGGLPDAPQ